MNQKQFKFLFYYYLLLLLTLSIFLVIKFLDIKLTANLDPFIIVIGNILIAIFITRYFTKKQKNDELALDHCLNDISELLDLLEQIRQDIKSHCKQIDDSTKVTKEEIISNFTFLGQLLDMLNNHSLIKTDDIEGLKEIYETYEDHLTGSAAINSDWFDSHLKLKRHILIMKSNVSKAFRQ